MHAKSTNIAETSRARPLVKAMSADISRYSPQDAQLFSGYFWNKSNCAGVCPMSTGDIS